MVLFIMRNKKNNKQLSGEGNNKDEQHTKKPFDKKLYRLKKYSNKYLIEQQEKRRKKAVIREFCKELRKDQQNFAQTSSNSKETTNDDKTSKNVNEGTNNKFKTKGYVFHKAKQEYLRKIDEKKKRIEEAARVKAERQEALQKYKEKKTHNFKVLSRKTKKGQPIMKDRLQMLLEQIEQSIT